MDRQCDNMKKHFSRLLCEFEQQKHNHKKTKNKNSAGVLRFHKNEVFFIVGPWVYFEKQSDKLEIPLQDHNSTCICILSYDGKC